MMLRVLMRQELWFPIIKLVSYILKLLQTLQTTLLTPIQRYVVQRVWMRRSSKLKLITQLEGVCKLVLLLQVLNEEINSLIHRKLH